MKTLPKLAKDPWKSETKREIKRFPLPGPMAPRQTRKMERFAKIANS